MDEGKGDTFEELRKAFFVAWDKRAERQFLHDPAFSRKEQISCKCQFCRFKVKIFVTEAFLLQHRVDLAYLLTLLARVKELGDASLATQHGAYNAGWVKELHPQPPAGWPFHDIVGYEGYRDS